jgi:hypothetical protein
MRNGRVRGKDGRSAQRRRPCYSLMSPLALNLLCCRTSRTCWPSTLRQPASTRRQIFVSVSYVLVAVRGGANIEKNASLVVSGRRIPLMRHAITTEMARSEDVPLGISVRRITDAALDAFFGGVEADRFSHLKAWLPGCSPIPR